MSVLLAVCAAACNALSSVLQRKANLAETERQQFGLRAIAHLPARPIWLLGVLAMTASFLLQAAALGLGTLSVVEPVLVLELPLTLLLGALLLHRRLRPRDGVAALAMAGGLALLIGMLAPSGGNAAGVPTARALAAAAVTAAAVTAVAAIAWLGPHRSRSALFGVAAGSGFGLTAGFMKLAVARLDTGGLAGLLGAWTTYATLAAGLGSLLLVQAALGSGTLVAAQPGITLLDPAVSVVWGTVVVSEQVRTGLFVLPAVAGFALIVAAAVALVRANTQAPDRTPAVSG